MTDKSYHLLQPPKVRWICPNCDATALKPRVLNHSEFHNCKGMNGFSVPMVEFGVKAKVTKTEREDYVGKEDVTTDADGRPIMNVTIEREDGNDCFVFAPIATVRKEG